MGQERTKMVSSIDSFEVRELREQLADARSLALQLQRELETARAALDDARRELWESARCELGEQAGADRRIFGRATRTR